MEAPMNTQVRTVVAGVLFLGLAWVMGQESNAVGIRRVAGPARSRPERAAPATVALSSGEGHAIGLEPLRPYVVLTGSDSAVQKAECLRITSDADWQALWVRHVAQLGRIKAGRPGAPRPQVDFQRCMVVAVFGGATWNTEGLRVVSTAETGGEIVIGSDWLSYQTMETADKVTPYAFIVMPASPKPILVQVDTRDLRERADNAPPKWQDLCRLSGTAAR